MSNKPKLQEREEKKILMIEHYAFASIINDMDPKLFEYFSVNNGYGAIEDIIRRYRMLVERCSYLFAQTGDEITFIDKAVCFAMSMKHKPIFHLNTDGKKNAKLKSVNEKVIAEAILAFLSCSEYKMHDHHKKLVFKEQWDLDGFDNGHKRELAAFRKQLVEECSKIAIDYETMVQLLNTIYLKGVMYKEEIDADLEEKVRSKLVAVETYEVPRKHAELKQEYILHKSKYRNMK